MKTPPPSKWTRSKAAWTGGYRETQCLAYEQEIPNLMPKIVELSHFHSISVSGLPEDVLFLHEYGAYQCIHRSGDDSNPNSRHVSKP